MEAHFSFFLFIFAGLVLLVAGGELLTSAASRLALIAGMAPIVIGLTIVAFGTSMPEAFVSIYAAFEGKADIAVANVIGSNIFNIAFILGAAAMIHPLKVQAGSLRREIPFVVLSAVLAWLFAWDRIISRMEGAILVIMLLVFMVICFRQTGSGNMNINSGERRLSGSKLKQALLIAGSLILLVFGAKLLVSGSSELARSAGVSELIIGLTIIAAGTSLPELATSVMASIRKKDDIAVGNVTGSNIFNIFLILGAASMIHPLSVSDDLFYRDIPLMIAISLITIPVMKSGFVISRLEGLGLVAVYSGYLVGLIKSS